MSRPRPMYLGLSIPATGGDMTALHVPVHHLTTHSVVLGMTGSGKTGLMVVMVEEALRSGVPCILIDVKGDLANLLLSFPSFAANHFEGWVEGHGAPDEPPAADLAAQLAAERQEQLGAWNLNADDLAQFRQRTELRVLTPGSSAGEPLHILSSLERRSSSWTSDRDAGRAALSAAISLVLRLIGTPAVIVSVAHLDDEERTLVLGVLLEELLAYTRSLPGSRRLRALVVFDEVYGLLPPHPNNPPTKRPTIALMKQGRAFGVGVVVSTQNPMDLDYRALSNAGFWAVGRLQTDADRARVVESLASSHDPGCTAPELDEKIRRLGQRWFLLRNVHANPSTQLLQPRWAMSFLRGPMTLGDVRRAAGR